MLMAHIDESSVIALYQVDIPLGDMKTTGTNATGWVRETLKEVRKCKLKLSLNWSLQLVP